MISVHNIAIVLVATVVILILKYKKIRHHKLQIQYYEMHSEDNTSTIVVNKSVAYGVITSTQEPFAMSVCSA